MNALLFRQHSAAYTGSCSRTSALEKAIFYDETDICAGGSDSWMKERRHIYPHITPGNINRENPVASRDRRIVPS